MISRALLLLLVISIATHAAASSPKDEELEKFARENVEDERYPPDETDIDQRTGSKEEIDDYDDDNDNDELKDLEEEEEEGAKTHIPDETDIDQRTGSKEEIDDPSEENGDDEEEIQDNSMSMTENEVNQKLGYKGDEMMFTDEQRKRGVSLNIRLWKENGKVRVPYVIHPSITSTHRNQILAQIAAMNGHVKCNRDAWTAKKSSDKYAVLFRYGQGCSSYLGNTQRFGANQPITLARPTSTSRGTCFVSGIILHEMLHAMGFSHEQSRSDRDNYVSIQYGNIQSGRASQFRKLQTMVQGSISTPYDYGSVMHYSRKAFSINGRDTIVPKRNVVGQIGQRRGLSSTDILELNRVYGCSVVPTRPPVVTRRRRRRRRRSSRRRRRRWFGKK